MFTPAFITIGRLLLIGLATAQPTASTATKPVAPNVAPASVKAAATQTTTAVRDYVSAAFPAQSSTITLTDPTSGTIELTSEEAALFVQTNQDREAQGLPDLQIDPLLCIIARNHSVDMAQRKYFDHLAPGPGPVSPMDRYLAALTTKPTYAFLGENIYYRSLTETTNVSANEANNAFMHSEGHRANILQPRFTKMGIGFYRDPVSGAFWVTEEFLSDGS